MFMDLFICTYHYYFYMEPDFILKHLMDYSRGVLSRVL